MDAEEIKQNIRRRLFAEKFRRGDPSTSASEYFVSCPGCRGTGQICRESPAGVEPAWASLEDCAACEGEGFIERPA